jgi:putative heme iron utilization protein
MEATTTADLAQRIREAFAKNPQRMTPDLAEEIGCSECEVIRCLPDGRSVELDVARSEELIKSFEELGPLHVLTNNGVVALEAYGQFGSFSRWGSFLNVQTKSLDMHIRLDRLGAVFAVEKPSHMDGVSTLSFQFFATSGCSAMKVFFNFGGRPTEERTAAFAERRERFRLKRQV